MNTKVEISITPETAHKSLCGDPDARDCMLRFALQYLEEHPPVFSDDRLVEYPLRDRDAAEPEITRDGSRLRIVSIAKPPITWTLKFPSEEWAVKVESGLRISFADARTYLDDRLDLETRFTEIVDRLDHFIRRYTVGVKWKFDGVDEAFGVVQA